MNKSESIGELAKAFADFHSKVKQPLKDKANPFFKSKYVPLENVVEAINQVAPKIGLSFMQYPVSSEGKVGVVTVVMHSSGEWIETEPIYTTPAKQDPQATGSAITYLKRYALSAAFGITSDEDDDGNSSSNNKQQAPQKSSSNAPKMISEPQMRAMQAKVNNVATANQQDVKDVFTSALKALEISKASSKDLTSAEASKVIEYLTKLE